MMLVSACDYQPPSQNEERIGIIFLYRHFRIDVGNVRPAIRNNDLPHGVGEILAAITALRASAPKRENPDQYAWISSTCRTIVSVHARKRPWHR